MKIKNALIGNTLKNIVIENGVITKLTSAPMLGADLDAGGRRLIPGMVDVHVHGFGGADTMDGDLSALKLNLANEGTTSFLPTTMTASVEDLVRVTSAKLDGEGAEAIGFHLEGPFLSVKKCGAQDPKLIIPADKTAFSQFKNAKMITVAPEEKGSIDFIKDVTNEGCIVALGHTDCDYDTAIKAIEAGANSLTHTFNAMPPLLHRDPGPIGAGMEKGVYAQLICDGRHVHRAAVLALYRMFGAEKLTLISDSLSCAGLPDGNYVSGGLPITLKNGEARLLDGTFAGSSTSLFGCMKKALEFGIPFEDALRMATQTPAELLGVKKGVIREGYDADLLVLDENLDIQNVIVGGRVFK